MNSVYCPNYDSVHRPGGNEEKTIEEFAGLWEVKKTILNRLDNIRGRLAHHAIRQVDFKLANLHDELRHALIQLRKVELQLNNLEIEQLKGKEHV